MTTALDCVPCIARQALDAARAVSREPVLHERIMRDVLQAIAGADLNQPPPVLGQRMHRRFRELTGIPDPSPWRCAAPRSSTTPPGWMPKLAGLDRIAEIVDNGSDPRGTVLEDCSAEFRARFESADLIIAKGQGNFETLSSVEANIFFLLKIKCPVVAAHTGLPIGTHALIRRGKAGGPG